MTYVEVNTLDEFKKEVVESDKLTLVDFWAPWCGPCRSFSPIFERVSEEMKDVKFVKINVDEAQEVAANFNIRSIPTLMLVKDGKVLKTQPGAMDDESLKDWINN